MATEAIKPTLHSPVQADGKRRPIHFRTEGGQVPLTGLRAFEALGLSESDTTNTAIEKLAEGVENAAGGIGTSVIGRALCYGELVIPSDGWESDETFGGYVRNIENAEITKEMVPYFFAVPESEEAAKKAFGAKGRCQTYDGGFRIYAKSVPETAVVVSAAFIGGLKGGGADGDLPIATKEQPGLVQIGDGLSVTESGTISVNTVNEEQARQKVADILNG